jgi:hypothetical protein
LYASGRAEVGQSAKKIFAYLMRISGFEGFLTSREFKLTLVEHDLDEVWTTTSESVYTRALPRALGVLGDLSVLGQYDRETLVWFVDHLLDLRKDKTLAFLDDVLERFRHTTSSRMNLDELRALLSESGYAADKISNMRLFSSVAETSKETVIKDARTCSGPMATPRDLEGEVKRISESETASA